MTTPRRPTLLYDGDCGVCDHGVARIRRRLDPPVDLRPFQQVDAAALGVSDAELAEGPVLVRTDGSHVVGPLAMAEVFRSARGPASAVGRLMLAPGVRSVLRAVGPTVYRQRHRLPGAAASCPAPGAR
ncbi:MAG: DCC1-like thiol-disulfide oxidoreductase family protein [Candidatus Nanopelagicales bacterium]